MPNPYRPKRWVTSDEGGSHASDVSQPTLDFDGYASDWTTAEVLSWVKRDPTRAAAALSIETGRGKPRVTLVRTLESYL